MTKKKYIDTGFEPDDDVVAQFSTADDPQRTRTKVVWTHLQSLKNYAPMMGRHREQAERTLGEADGHISRAYTSNSSKALGKALEGLGTVTNSLVNHLGANHPIAQEVLANHAGAVAAHAAHVEASAKAGH